MTSSPGLTPNASIARCSAAPQLLTATASPAPYRSFSWASRALPLGPWPAGQPEANTSATAASSCSPRLAKTRGILLMSLISWSRSARWGRRGTDRSRRFEAQRRDLTDVVTPTHLLDGFLVDSLAGRPDLRDLLEVVLVNG